MRRPGKTAGTGRLALLAVLLAAVSGLLVWQWAAEGRGVVPPWRSPGLPAAPVGQETAADPPGPVPAPDLSPAPGPQPAAPPPEPVAVKERAGLVLRLEVRSLRFALGDPVRLVLRVENPGTEPVLVRYFTSQRADFTVESAGRVVWQWQGDPGEAALSLELLPPGGRLEFTAVWDQTVLAGRMAPRGRYGLRGVFIGTWGPVEEPTVVGPVWIELTD